ncbi:MAG: AAA family ATPase [Saprospiraceae bacterium]|nr:AAA family ATPase [Saprospiraceae bacterium]
MDNPHIWQYRVLAVLLSRWEVEYGHLGVDHHARLLRICWLMAPDIPLHTFGQLLCPLFVTEPLMQERFRVLYEQIIQELGLSGAGPGFRIARSIPPTSPEAIKSPAPPDGKKDASFERISSPQTGILMAELGQCVDPPFSWNIVVSDESNTNALLKNTPEYALSNRFGKIAQYLRRRETMEVDVLDLPATIQATIRQYGLPDLRYYTPTQLPEYLLLIERFSQQDHRASLFDFFFEELRSRQVFIERFFYDGDPRICRNSRYPEGLTIRQLRYNYPDARILVLGSGHRLIDNRTGNLCDWTVAFQDWPLRVLLTPVPPDQWGYHENRLKRLFAILPATVSSLQYIGELPELMATQYEEMPDFIQQLSKVKTIALEEPIVLSLSEYFDPPMLCWIASCAIYPSLHYPLTLQIGRLLSHRLGQNLLSLEHVTALSTIPWFADGKIPFEYRKELVAYLKHRHPRHYEAVTHYLQQLMEDNPPPPNSVAWADHQMQLALYRASTSSLPSEGILEELRTVVKKLYREKRLEDFPLPEPWSAILEKWGFESDLQSNNAISTVTGVAVIDEVALSAAMQELHSMVGLGDVKKKIAAWVDTYRQNIFDTQKGYTVLKPPSYPNFVFVGNHGTGKTSVAQILGKILKALGLLENGFAIETRRSDYVAAQAQQTELKTRRLIARHRGNLLIIADANMLHIDISDTYGKTAIQTLASLIDEKQGQFALVACGNTRNMESFMSFNPELKDKLPVKILFRDYTPDELADILRHQCQKSGYILDEIVDNAFIRLQLENYERLHNPGVENAGIVEKFLKEKVLPRYRLRQDATHGEALIRISDFPEYQTERSVTGSPPGGFAVICSRCNKYCIIPVLCERFDCELPEYYDAYAKVFKVAPTKYYCSLSGGINSGKTVFLLTLIDSLLHPSKELKSFYQKNKISNIGIIDPVSIKLLKSLIAESSLGQLQITKLNTPLEFFNLIIRLTNGIILEIVLFNSSGEKIEDEYNKQNIITAAHELKGSSVIHLVDPREDSSLNKLLMVPKAYDECSNKEITEYIYEVLRYVNRGVTIANQPLAICISKFDLLLPLIPLVLTDDPFIEVQQVDFFKKIDATSKSLSTFLANNRSTVDPISLQKQFKKHKYFAIAPFGSDAMPAYWKDRASKGIHAPFFWVLKELRII